MDLKFRKLEASEIECRVGSINKGGVSLLLYKDARVDQYLLDEIVGPLNWQRSHSRDNANCIVSIWDDSKKQWVSKEDTGSESNAEAQKGLASDSFKRACFNWGIGRELYSASQLGLFIKAADLKGYSFENNKGKCYDTFKVSEIEYEGDVIKKVKIDVYYYGTKHCSRVFENNTIVPKAVVTTTPSPEPKQQTQAAKPQPEPVPPANTLLFTDDEVILIGGCRGKTFGEAKQSSNFQGFLNWVKNTTQTYNGEAETNQLRKFKAYVAG